MNKKERDVLQYLCDGEITFSEAADKLGITEKEIEEMLDDYSWLPSPEKLAELNETEIETLLYIREISQQFRPKISIAHSEIQFNDAKVIRNAHYQTYFTPISTGNVIMNYTEGIPNKTILTVSEEVQCVSGEMFKSHTINLSSEDTEVCPLGINQSINTHFRFKSTQPA